MIFEKYDKCIYCKSKNLKKEKDQSFKTNFYLDAIKSDLNISTKKLSQSKVYKCQRCKILQNNPWSFLTLQDLYLLVLHRPLQ